MEFLDEVDKVKRKNRKNEKKASEYSSDQGFLAQDTIK
jgi:hypothetical protein